MSNRRDFLLASGAAAWVGLHGNFLSAAPKPGPKQLIFRTETPRNGEPALEKLIESWITPNELFYVRSHAPIPQIDVDQYRLTVEGLVERPLSLSLGQLSQKFKTASAVATLTCAGNRRTEFNEVQKVGGVQWGAGAIGNAKWEGYNLADVLRAAGVKEGAKHVCFEGLDEIAKGGGVIPFGGSIPLEKVFEETSVPGAIVATKMNGQPLPPDHGYPVRALAPGYIGARSVKWLGRITVSDRPSFNHYVAKAYKVVGSNAATEWAEAGPLYRFVVNSAICTISGAKSGKVTIQGYALPTGVKSSKVDRVEVSVDGVTWRKAQFLSEAKAFCWRLWKAEIPIPDGATRLLVRAADSTGHMQPQRVDWNYKGYMNNAWHEVSLGG